MEMRASSPPMAGPVIPPSRKPPWKKPAARPRICGATLPSSRLIADTVNIAEPIPPMPRSASSCG